MLDLKNTGNGSLLIIIKNSNSTDRVRGENVDFPIDVLESPGINVAIAYEAGFNIPNVDFDEYGNPIIEKDGMPCSFVAYWTGEMWEPIAAVASDTRLLSGGQGPCVGENIVTVSSMNYGKLPIKKQLKKLGVMMRESSAEPNLYRFDVMLKKDEVYYNRITMDIGEEVVSSMTALLENRKLGKGYSAAMKLFAYPYEKRHNLLLPLSGLPNILAGEESYYMVMKGSTVKDVWDAMYDCAKRLPKGICYRTDGLKMARGFYKKLREYCNM